MDGGARSVVGVSEHRTETIEISWWEWLSPRKRIAVVVAVIAVGALSLGLLVLSRWLDQREIVAECHEEIETRLVAPATATYKDDLNPVADDGFIVSGTVDAENGLGTPLRYDFSCLVKEAPYGYYVRLAAGT